MDGKARVAWNLRRHRVAAGVSQETLATDAGVDRTFVGRIERGLENPTVGILDRLAEALGIDVAEFLTKPRPGERRPKPLKAGRKPAR
ncbi:MAG: transcriptional regulator [Rhodospirillales bacterium 20-64-7]|nr:MAG: transcriptional regulator [Rhodospirillales bacterium 20-64-7]